MVAQDVVEEENIPGSGYNPQVVYEQQNREALAQVQHTNDDIRNLNYKPTPGKHPLHQPPKPATSATNPSMAFYVDDSFLDCFNLDPFNFDPSYPQFSNLDLRNLDSSNLTFDNLDLSIVHPINDWSPPWIWDDTTAQQNSYQNVSLVKEAVGRSDSLTQELSFLTPHSRRISSPASEPDFKFASKALLEPVSIDVPQGAAVSQAGSIVSAYHSRLLELREEQKGKFLEIESSNFNPSSQDQRDRQELVHCEVLGTKISNARKCPFTRCYCRTLSRDGLAQHQVLDDEWRPDEKALSPPAYNAKDDLMQVVSMRSAKKDRKILDFNLELEGVAVQEELPFTDSGYASILNHNLVLKVQSSPEGSKLPNSINSTILNEKDREDAETLYSAETLFSPARAKNYITDLCNDIHGKLQSYYDAKNWKIMSKILPVLIKAFAIKIGHYSSNPKNQDIMYFIYKRHE